MRWRPQDLLRDTAHDLAGQPPTNPPRLLREGSREICGVSIDTRSLQPGSLFVPLVAARDGHDFLSMAVDKGAAAVLVDAAHETLARTLPEDLTVIVVADTQDALTRLACAQQSPHHPRICITGSNGKTTTRALLGAVLRLRYPQLQETQGNLNNHLGVPLTLLGAPHEPDARLIEFGMNAMGENRHLSQVFGPSIGIITSIALEHLEFMGSLANIAKAEAEPVHDLPPGSLLTIPFGQPVLEHALDEIPRAKDLNILRVGYEKESDIRVQIHRIDERTRGSITLPGHSPMELALPIIGAHNLLNAAYALAVGHHLGIDHARMKEALEATTSVGSRGKVHTWGPHRFIADCYNANPGSMQAALESLAHTDPARPKIAVLADMFELGPTAPNLHEQTMELASRQGLQAIFAKGPLSQAALRTLPAPPQGTEHHMLPEDPKQAAQLFAQALKKYPRGATVLFKASRGMKLETLLEELLSMPA